MNIPRIRSKLFSLVPYISSKRVSLSRIIARLSSNIWVYFLSVSSKASMQPFTIVPTSVVDKFLTDNAVKVNESNRYEQAYQLAVDYPDLPRPREIRLWLQALITNLSLTRSSTIWLSKIPNKADTILLLTYAGKLIDDIMSVDIGLIFSINPEHLMDFISISIRNGNPARVNPFTWNRYFLLQSLKVHESSCYVTEFCLIYHNIFIGP